MSYKFVPHDHETLFTRYPNNPILTTSQWPYHVNSVFNPGAIKYNGKYLLLVRVEDKRGFSHLNTAVSDDGKTNWKISSKPVLYPTEKYMEEQWGLEDPRIVYMKDLKKYAVTYVSFSKGGPVVSLALTENFRRYKRMGVLLPPEDKDACLFPGKFKGRYALIHRPVIRGEAHIWISFSPDLKHWGDHKIILETRPGSWDCHRVGLGPQPIRTKDGWLIIYHGVRLTASGSIYRVGLALYDINDPTKLIKRSEEWVFGPKKQYERTGDVASVTFPTGVIYHEETKEIYMYYGAADSSICLAFAKIDRILDYLKS